jgi:hypothetical protein
VRVVKKNLVKIKEYKVIVQKIIKMLNVYGNLYVK